MISKSIKSVLKTLLPKKYSNIIYYSYPQYIWALEIGKVLNKINKPGYLIIDAPCGDGIISYWLKKSTPNNLLLCDISVEAIEKAKEHIHGVEIYCDDINNIKVNDREAIWLLMNSFFLLPNMEELIRKLSNTVKYIICIIPNVNSKSFLLWRQENPDFTHHYEMTEKEAINFFSKQGYGLISQKNINHLSHYSRKNSFLYPFYLRIYNVLDNYYKDDKSCHFIMMVFKSVN
ncbi:MAG: class I SAM-dependent methyltransferase [Bacteroidetes bacterium]|nr:class I SAM-dependent methyltransferase [Bacteroidota bacterium]